MDFISRGDGLKVFFIGIGGINMSALAAYLIEKGFSVFGSDRTFTSRCERLSDLGATVYQGHSAENVEGKDIVVVSSAISEDNEEFVYAKNNKIPIYKRAELLALIGKNFDLKIGVSGAHGKTTVTALITHILYEDGKKFTSFIGGDDKKFGNYYRSGNDILLSEVCEFKKNIDYFEPDVAVTLNIDNDHLDSYRNFSDLTETFFRFLKK